MVSTGCSYKDSKNDKELFNFTSLKRQYNFCGVLMESNKTDAKAKSQKLILPMTVNFLATSFTAYETIYKLFITFLR